MPPKLNTETVTTIFIRSIGGEICAVSSLAPKIGPLGLSPKKIGEQLCKATKEWEGLRVMCKLTVKNRIADPEVVPSASVMIIKFLREPKRDRKKEKNIKHNGNLELKEIISIAKIMRHRSLSVTLVGGIKEILGTATSIGCTVNKTKPRASF